MCIYMAARLKHKDRRRRERPTDEGLWSGGGVPFFSLSLSPCVPKFYFLLKLALGKGGKKKNRGRLLGHAAFLLNTGKSVE